MWGWSFSRMSHDCVQFQLLRQRSFITQENSTGTEWVQPGPRGPWTTCCNIPSVSILILSRFLKCTWTEHPFCSGSPAVSCILSRTTDGVPQGAVLWGRGEEHKVQVQSIGWFVFIFYLVVEQLWSRGRSENCRFRFCSKWRFIELDAELLNVSNDLVCAGAAITSFIH